MSLVELFAPLQRSRRVLSLVLSRDAVVLLSASLDPKQASEAMTEPVADGSVQALLVTVAAVLTERQRQSPQAEPFLLRVLLEDCWVSLATLPWTAGLAKPSTSDDEARRQLLAGGVDLSPDDTIRLDDAPYQAPRLAVRYPAALVQGLERLALAHKLVLTQMLPISVVAWPLAVRQGAKALMVAQPGSVVLLQGEGRHVQQVLQRAPASEPSLAIQAWVWWQRTRARDALPLDGKVAWMASPGVTPPVNDSALWFPLALPGAEVDSDADASASSPQRWFAQLECLVRAVPTSASLDAIRRGAGLPASRVAAKLSVALAVAMLLWAGQSRLLLQASRAELTEASLPPRQVSPQVWRRDELARVQSINAAIRTLNVPIGPLLAALQPPRDLRVAVLDIDLLSGAEVKADEGGGSTVRITAEAPTGSEMARYVTYVGGHKPFNDAYLTRHEIQATSGEPTYRFTLEAKWRE